MKYAKYTTNLVLFSMITATFLLSGNSFADTLTWEDCLKQAKSNNLDIKTALIALERAKSDVNSAKTAYVPQLTFNTSHTQPLFVSDSSSDSVGLSLSQKLFPLFVSNPDLERSIAQLEGQEASLEQTLASSLYTLKTAFDTVYFSQLRVDLVTKIAKRRQQNLALVKAKFESGYENKGAYLRSKAQTEQAKSDVNQAKRDLEIAQDTLRQLIGGKSSSFTVESHSNKTTDTLKPSDDLLNTIPSLKLAQANVKASRLQEQITDLSYSPQLSASLSYDKSIPDSSARSTTGRLSLSFPLWTWGKQDLDKKSAQLDTEKLVISLQNLVEQTRNNLKQLSFQILNTEEDVTIQQLFEEAAQTRSEIAQKSYQAGLLSFENWDIIESDFINQQQSTLTKQKALFQAKASLNQALGKGF